MDMSPGLVAMTRQLGDMFLSLPLEDHGIYRNIAYVKTEAQIKEFWPEATGIDVMQRDVEITFSDRFAKPDWWEGEKNA